MEPPAPVNEPRPTGEPRRPEHYALAVSLVLVLGLLLYRGYGNGYSARPTEQTTARLPLNLNSADRTELLQVPGVGPNLADAILSHRNTFGRFQSLDELDSVKGIGGKTIDKLRPWIQVESAPNPKQNLSPNPPIQKVETLTRPAPPPAVSTPSAIRKLQPNQQIDINTATLIELQQLPAIGPKLAERIIAEREKMPFSTLQDLRRVSGIGPKTIEKLQPHLRFERP